MTRENNKKVAERCLVGTGRTKAAHTEELYNSMTEEIDEPVETIQKHVHEYEEVMVKMEQKAKNCEFKVCCFHVGAACGVCGFQTLA